MYGPTARDRAGSGQFLLSMYALFLLSIKSHKNSVSICVSNYYWVAVILKCHLCGVLIHA